MKKVKRMDESRNSRLFRRNRCFFIRLLLPLTLLPTVLHAQTSDFSVTIQGITIEEKANGTLIRIKKIGYVTPSQVTAWVSETQWFYVTILQGTIDTTQRFPFVPTGIVKGFQCQNLQESVQLSFRITKQIESFEINTSENEDEILITLRLPLEETLASIEKLKSLKGEEVAVSPASEASIFDKIPYALMFSGSAILVTGLIDSNKRQIGIGGLMILSGYLLLKKD